MQKILLVFLLAIFPTYSHCGNQHLPEEKVELLNGQECEEGGHCRRLRNPFCLMTQEKVHHFSRNLFVDSANFWKNVFTLSTMKVMTATIPLYLVTKPADCIVHKQFYDPVTHTDKNQPPVWLQKITTDDATVAIPFVLLGMLGWFSEDPILRRQAQVFAVGIGWTYVAKVALKHIVEHDEISSRPKCGRYPQTSNTPYGAIPSGHSAFFAFCAAFWGLERGASWGVPLGMATLAVMALNVSVNRHYLSQVFVGAGLGVAFGVAGHKTSETARIKEGLTVSFAPNWRGNMGITLAYDF